MSRKLPLDWPPLITDASVPRLLVVRDYALTILAWLALAWIAEHEIVLIVAQVRELFGAPPGRPLPDWQLWWDRLRPYVIAVAAMAAWLLAWGVAALRRTRRFARMPQPEPLSAADHAAQIGCSEAELVKWRSLKFAVVHIDAGDHIRVESGTPPA